MKLVAIFITTLLCANVAFGVGGELMINKTGSYSVTVQLEQIADGWNWTNSSVIYNREIFSPGTFTNASTSDGLVCRFANPKKIGGAGQGVLPWTLIRFTVSGANISTKIFTIDFKDENWAEETSAYPNPDSDLIINSATGVITFKYVRSGITYEANILNNGTYRIWELCHATGRMDDNFSPKFIVQNNVNGQNAGGKLSVNSNIYTSGNEAPRSSGNNLVATCGNSDTITYDDFINSGIIYKHHDWNAITNDYLLSHNATGDYSAFKQSAYFRPLSPATIKAQLQGGGTTAEVELRDPWYVSDNSNSQPNSFYTVLATNNFIPAGKCNGTAGGIFLGQDYNVSGNQYYSVRAPLLNVIGNNLAFFQNWSGTNVTFQNANGLESAIVFNSNGASAIANYSNATVTYNTTISSNTYTIAGSLTIPAGVSLTLSPGTILQFASGATLYVNGNLYGNGASLTAADGTWNGIVISGVNNNTISGVNISAFGGTEAIRVSGSTPILTNVHINGQTGSWNGIRFTNGSGGSMIECTIQNCGAGNGVVIEGNSYPQIFGGNTITNNRYHGIYIGNNYATPYIHDNTISGSYEGVKLSAAIYAYQAGCVQVQNNSLQNGAYGVASYQYSNVISSSSYSSSGNNTITGNTSGLAANNHGAINFGSHYGNSYDGTCNTISGNVQS